MTKVCIILRGVPGCGKSTVADYLAQLNNATVCVADDFFMENGNYNFDINKLHLAHQWCQDKFLNCLKNGQNVIVANTSTTEKELIPYITTANEYGYLTFSMVVENRHGGTNVHNVPEETLEKMKNRFSVKL